MYSRSSALQGNTRRHYILQPAIYRRLCTTAATTVASRQHLPWQELHPAVCQLGQTGWHSKPERKLVYAYVPDLDSLMHHKGTTPPAKHSLLLERLQRHCAELAATPARAAANC